MIVKKKTTNAESLMYMETSHQGKAMKVIKDQV